MKNLFILTAVVLTGCAGSSFAKDVHTGAVIGSEACTWIEEATQSGAVLSICATLDEIAKWGKHPAKILRARGEAVPGSFDEK